MKYFVLATLLFSTHCFSALQAGEWISLFDGKTTHGWNPRGKTTVFEVKDGAICLAATTNVWVTSDLEMQDFEVEAEVFTPEDAANTNFNSGICFRGVGETGKPNGYQIEIDGRVKGVSGGIHGIGLGGWLVPTKNAAERQAFEKKTPAIIKAGQWNQFRVVAKGAVISTYVNGTKMAEITNAKVRKGFFGIQHHGKGGTVKFRNIRARELVIEKDKNIATQPTKPRPNILWITVEDMSATLGCYGDKFANTPTIDQLAKESVLYQNAFAVSPICAPSRSTLITGIHNATMGTHNMRSANRIPTGVQGFASFLRKAGYYTSNNVKTDYNCAEAKQLVTDCWDNCSPTADWSAKKEEQPFFHIFNDMTTHQSRTMVWNHGAFEQHIQSKLDPTKHSDPKLVPLPPYYPDTPEVRKTMARFYDCVAVMDQNVKALLERLEVEGLAEDTIVFFYSDHGSGMPRHKRLLHDSGMHVPLMIRFPKKYQHLAPAKPGTRLDRLVNFVDFPASLLNLLELPVPKYMQGKPFLGADSDQQREVVYGTRDRVDEVFDMSRSIRDSQYLYIRNYMPHLSFNQPSVFPDLGEIRQSINKVADQKFDQLTPAQQFYAGPRKPVEELYDCLADPMNLNNLAGNADHAELLTKMRATYIKRRTALRDTGALPESVMWDFVREEKAPIADVLAGKTNHVPDMATAWAAADLVGLKDRDALIENIDSWNPSVRYWAIIGMQADFADDKELHELAVDHVEHISPDIRIEAANWLANHSDKHRAYALERLIADVDHPDWWVALRACRAIELAGEKARPLLPQMKELYTLHRDQKGDQSFFLAFSAGAFLDKMGEQTKPWDFTPGARSMFADPDAKKKK